MLTCSELVALFSPIILPPTSSQPITLLLCHKPTNSLMKCLLFEDATPCCLPALPKTHFNAPSSLLTYFPRALFSQLMCDQLPWPLVHRPNTAQTLSILRVIIHCTEDNDLLLWVFHAHNVCVDYLCLAKSMLCLPHVPSCPSALIPLLHLPHLPPTHNHLLMPLIPTCCTTHPSPLTPHHSPLTEHPLPLLQQRQSRRFL